MSRVLQLSRGKTAIVDDADYEWLSQWKWLYITSGYAARRFMENGKQRCLYLHRFLLDAPPCLEVDHINHDKLDNRRCNLRLVTVSQNQQNKAPSPNKVSIYKGVTLMKGRWRATISVNGKYTHLGYYSSESEAAEAYNRAAAEYFGEYARLNALIE